MLHTVSRPTVCSSAINGPIRGPFEPTECLQTPADGCYIALFFGVLIKFSYMNRYAPLKMTPSLVSCSYSRLTINNYLHLAIRRNHHALVETKREHSLFALYDVHCKNIRMSLSSSVNLFHPAERVGCILLQIYCSTVGSRPAYIIADDLRLHSPFTIRTPDPGIRAGFSGCKMLFQIGFYCTSNTPQLSERAGADACL